MPVDRPFPKGAALAGAALVLGLAALVFWSVPREAPSNPALTRDEAGPPEEDATRKAGELDRSGFAECEFAILTTDDVGSARLATREAIAGLVGSPHCGAACDAVHAFLRDEDRFEVERMSADDYVLPPQDTWDTVAPDLTPSERESIDARRYLVVVRSRGEATALQMPARAAFAATAAAARALSGLVYDETARRIETAGAFAAHAITAPLGDAVFSPGHVVVQLHRQEDGSARLLTLGMLRFGSPDFVLRGASMEIAPALAHVVNAVAASAAAGKTALPLTVSLADVARVTGRAPAEIAAEPDSSREVRLDAIVPERQAGDPVNDLAELVPPRGTTSEAWAEVVRSLFGENPALVHTSFDDELERIAKQSRRALPRALARFQADAGALFVKGPFPIGDAGAGSSEWLWLRVRSCDEKACTGTLTAAPAYAEGQAGSAAKIARPQVADWVLRLHDGGTEGGESIRLLAGRVRSAPR